MYESSTSATESTLIRPKRRGKHKIFIGMSPGVGKTYRMLEEAHCLRQEGIDVVIGLLETHNRAETAQKGDRARTSTTSRCHLFWHHPHRNGYRGDSGAATATRTGR